MTTPSEGKDGESVEEDYDEVKQYVLFRNIYLNAKTLPVMAGPVPAIPLGRAPCVPDRDRRDKPGDDEVRE